VHCTSLFILQQIDQHVGKGRTIDATYLWHRSQFGTYVYIWPTMSIIVIDIDNHGWYFLRAMYSSSPSPHSLLLFSVSRVQTNAMLSLRQGIVDSILSMWEKEMWPCPCGRKKCGHDLREKQDKKLHSFGLFLPKGTCLQVLGPLIDRSVSSPFRSINLAMLIRRCY
jgi:hypothetical protein